MNTCREAISAASAESPDNKHANSRPFRGGCSRCRQTHLHVIPSQRARWCGNPHNALPPCLSRACFATARQRRGCGKCAPPSSATGSGGSHFSAAKPERCIIKGLSQPGGETDCHVASLLAMTRDGVCLHIDSGCFRSRSFCLPGSADAGSHPASYLMLTFTVVERLGLPVTFPSKKRLILTDFELPGFRSAGSRLLL